MDKFETLKRKIILKRQAIPLIRGEILEHEERYVLLRMLERLESQIGDDRDPELSQKIDCINYLLENHGLENERSNQRPL